MLDNSLPYLKKRIIIVFITSTISSDKISRLILVAPQYTRSPLLCDPAYLLLLPRFLNSVHIPLILLSAVQLHATK